MSHFRNDDAYDSASNSEDDDLASNASGENMENGKDEEEEEEKMEEEVVVIKEAVVSEDEESDDEKLLADTELDGEESSSNSDEFSDDTGDDGSDSSDEQDTQRKRMARRKRHYSKKAKGLIGSKDKKKRKVIKLITELSDPINYKQLMGEQCGFDILMDSMYGPPEHLQHKWKAQERKEHEAYAKEFENVPRSKKIHALAHFLMKQPLTEVNHLNFLREDGSIDEHGLCQELFQYYRRHPSTLHDDIMGTLPFSIKAMIVGAMLQIRANPPPPEVYLGPGAIKNIMSSRTSNVDENILNRYNVLGDYHNTALVQVPFTYNQRNIVIDKHEITSRETYETLLLDERSKNSELSRIALLNKSFQAATKSAFFRYDPTNGYLKIHKPGILRRFIASILSCIHNKVNVNPGMTILRYTGFLNAYSPIMRIRRFDIATTEQAQLIASRLKVNPLTRLTALYEVRVCNEMKSIIPEHLKAPGNGVRVLNDNVVDLLQGNPVTRAKNVVVINGRVYTRMAGLVNGKTVTQTTLLGTLNADGKVVSTNYNAAGLIQSHTHGVIVPVTTVNINNTKGDNLANDGRYLTMAELAKLNMMTLDEFATLTNLDLHSVVDTIDETPTVTSVSRGNHRMLHPMHYNVTGDNEEEYWRHAYREYYGITYEELRKGSRWEAAALGKRPDIRLESFIPVEYRMQQHSRLLTYDQLQELLQLVGSSYAFDFTYPALSEHDEPGTLKRDGTLFVMHPSMGHGDFQANNTKNLTLRDLVSQEASRYHPSSLVINGRYEDDVIQFEPHRSFRDYIPLLMYQSAFTHKHYGTMFDMSEKVASDRQMNAELTMDMPVLGSGIYVKKIYLNQKPISISYVYTVGPMFGFDSCFLPLYLHGKFHQTGKLGAMGIVSKHDQTTKENFRKGLEAFFVTDDWDQNPEFWRSTPDADLVPRLKRGLLISGEVANPQSLHLLTKKEEQEMKSLINLQTTRLLTANEKDRLAKLRTFPISMD